MKELSEVRDKVYRVREFLPHLQVGTHAQRADLVFQVLDLLRITSDVLVPVCRGEFPVEIQIVYTVHTLLQRDYVCLQLVRLCVVVPYPLTPYVLQDFVIELKDGLIGFEFGYILDKALVHRICTYIEVFVVPVAEVVGI
ncbi:MAG: hypothetical protein II616_04610 [Bacteroidales bacterium]|nr:hypothetical protein [Bacteroidales bacterium]